MIGRRKSRGERKLRIVFATDLHGADLVFRKFLNAVSIYEADIAVLGGDLTAKRLVPVVVTDDGRLAPEQGPELVADVASGNVDTVLTEVRDRGRYPVAVTVAEYEHLATNGARVEDLFAEACKDQLERWLSLAHERLGPRTSPRTWPAAMMTTTSSSLYSRKIRTRSTVKGAFWRSLRAWR